MKEELWVTVEEFLSLFSVDTKRAGARDFIDLTEMYSVQLLFPELEVSKRLIVKMLLSKKGISPLIFWSRMKRYLLPILSADSETLAARGCPLAAVRTCPDLVEVLAVATAGHIESEHREKYRDVAVYVKKMIEEQLSKKMDR